MKKTIIYLFCAFAYTSFSQVKENVRVGIQFSAVIETPGNHGIVPSVLLSYKQHECVFGARFGFDQMNQSGRKLFLNPDFTYRYFVRIKSERIRPFGSILFNYYSNYRREEGYYDHSKEEQFSLYGPVFGHSFNLRQESLTQTYGLFLAPGVEISLWKQLFVQLSGGPGLIWRKNYEKYTNLDNGQTEGEKGNNWKYIRSCQWFAAAGLGYRF